MKTDIVQSVTRTFDIIEALQSGALGLMDLSKKVGLSKSTVHRLLNTLIYRGYVIQDASSSKYRLTLRFLEIGNHTIEDMDIVDISKPYIEKLAELTGEVVHLVLIEKKDIVYIDKIETKSTIRMHSYVGKRIPLYSSAVGKAYLAHLSSEQFEALWETIEPELKKFTEKTITTKTGMLAEISKIKERGFAIDDEENEEGVICVAAPILDRSNTVQYAISISTPKMRLDASKLDEFSTLVRNTAQEISRNLGHLI